MSVDIRTRAHSPRTGICSDCGLAIDPSVEPSHCVTFDRHEVCWKAADARQRLEDERRNAEHAAREAAHTGQGILKQLPRWEHADLDSPAFEEKCRSAKMRKLAAQWTPEIGSVLLLGKSGIGKTTAAIALFRRLVKEAVAAGGKSEHMMFEPGIELQRARFMLWCEAAQLSCARREHELGDGEPKLLKDAKNAWVLFIDELGSEAPDRDGDIFAILDRRDKNGRPTIVTSGLRDGEFIAKYGDALRRRIVERGVKIEEFGGG